VAGTARAFDGSGCGYMTLSINATAVASEYVRLADSTGLEPCHGNGAEERRAVEECARRFTPVEDCDGWLRLQQQRVVSAAGLDFEPLFG
jgi:hypothetical protein